MEDKDFIKKQVFNTTAALYKVTQKLPETEPLRQRLREKGVDLLSLVQDVFSGKIFNSDVQNILKQEFENMGMLLEFGRFYSNINPVNFSVLIQSYDALWRKIESALDYYANGGYDESLQELISGIKDPLDEGVKSIPAPEKAPTPKKEITPKIQSVKKERVERRYDSQPIGAKQAVRQEQIIKILSQKSISQFQLKDILGEFPQFNEKTVRNDLKVLCESGILVREGAGRSSVYKISNSAILNSENKLS